MNHKKNHYSDYEKKRHKHKKVIIGFTVIVLVLIIAVIVGGIVRMNMTATNQLKAQSEFVIPVYSGSVYEEINGNIPFFNDDELSTSAFETYSPMDELGRCGPAYACLGVETMPTEERGSIGMIKPSGWHTIRYDDLIEGKYLYNRCHLIAYMLSGENANENNLITGTRYMNVTGMLPMEIATANYISKTKNHVMYRVTPYFEGHNLVASGVLMEGKSVEDNGTGLSFNVFVFNVQPGIIIDYTSGESQRE